MPTCSGSDSARVSAELVTRFSKKYCLSACFAGRLAADAIVIFLDDLVAQGITLGSSMQHEQATGLPQLLVPTQALQNLTVHQCIKTVAEVLPKSDMPHCSGWNKR